MRPDHNGAFGRGFWALAPRWLGVIPFGLAYAGLVRRTALPDFWARSLHLVPIARLRLARHAWLLRIPF